MAPTGAARHLQAAFGERIAREEFGFGTKLGFGEVIFAIRRGEIWLRGGARLRSSSLFLRALGECVGIRLRLWVKMFYHPSDRNIPTLFWHDLRSPDLNPHFQKSQICHQEHENT